MVIPKLRSTKGEIPLRRVLLANPRGFCAGVSRAVDAVERALSVFGPPVYVRRAIVHNRDVVKRLEAMGAIFVRETGDAPVGSIIILSAHGVGKEVAREAKARRQRVIDATCPLVAKVHAHVATHHRSGRHILLIGHADHPETVGTMGQVPVGAISVLTSLDDLDSLELPASTRIAYAVQTTFSVHDARILIEGIVRRFADVAAPRTGNICYATTNRQSAIERIAAKTDYVLVVGDPTSSNAKRLVEVAHRAGRGEAALVSGRSDLDWSIIDRMDTIGMTAAASTPSATVDNICDALAERGFFISETDGTEETVEFKPVVVGTA